ncbi:MAG: hypothetical protein AAGE52_29945 [Myxococcota bacterium]
MRLLPLLALLILAAGCFEVGCPCGSDPSDPLSQHDLSYAGLHVLEAECACRCGGDAPIAYPRDRDCSEYEGECVDESGAPAELSCQ